MATIPEYESLEPPWSKQKAQKSEHSTILGNRKDILASFSLDGPKFRMQGIPLAGAHEGVQTRRLCLYNLSGFVQIQPD